MDEQQHVLLRKAALASVVIVLAAACSSSPTSSIGVPAVVSTPVSSAPLASSAASAGTQATPAPSAAAVGSGKAFVMTGVLPTFPKVVDGNLDPTTFITAVPDDSAQVFVVYLLGAGFNGTVTATWTDTDSGKSFVLTDAPAAFPTSKPNWQWNSSNLAGGWLADGHYRVNLTFGPTGEMATVPFTIIPGPGAVSSAAAAGTPAPSSWDAFIVLTMATSADPSRPEPDPSTFTSSYSTTAPALYLVFELDTGLVGRVTCSISEDGVEVVKPFSIDSGTSNRWAFFKIDAGSGFTAGSYVANVTFVPTGERASINFTVH